MLPRAGFPSCPSSLMLPALLRERLTPWNQFLIQCRPVPIMQAKQRVLLTISGSHTVDWEIEVERNGKWLATLYGGSCSTVDDAFVAAKRYLHSIEEIVAL